ADSNCRPAVYETAALPAELRRLGGTSGELARRGPDDADEARSAYVGPHWRFSHVLNVRAAARDKGGDVSSHRHARVLSRLVLRIDAFPHILPPKFFQVMFEKAGPLAANLGKRVRGIPVLYDLEARWRALEEFGDDYRQILTLAHPPIEALGPPTHCVELARRANDEVADLVAKHGRFLGFAASLPMNDPDGAVREAQRAVRELGALGIQIHTNVNGMPLDDPRFAPLFAAMAELDKPIWVHPARIATHPDYVTEQRSKVEVWWVFGWPYETPMFIRETMKNIDALGLSPADRESLYEGNARKVLGVH